MSNEADRQQLENQATAARNSAMSHKARHDALKTASKAIDKQKEDIKTARKTLDSSASGVISRWKGKQADSFASTMDAILDRIKGHASTVDTLQDNINNEAAAEHAQYQFFLGNADRLWTRITNLFNG